MKRLYDKLWAKIAAYFLTLLFGIATILGGTVLYELYLAAHFDYDYDAKTALPMPWLWVLALLCLALTIAALCFSLAAAGHWPGHGEPHRSWPARIPLDGFVAVLTLLWAWYSDGPGALTECVLVLFVLLAWLFVLSFVARCKAGVVLSDTLIWRGLRLGWRGLCWLGRQLPLLWKVLAAGLGLTALELLFLLLTTGFTEPQFLLFLLWHLALLAAALWLAVDLRRLGQGGQRLAEGDFSHPVSVSRVTLPELKQHAENLNAAQQGIRRAVEEATRSERMKTQLITNVSHDIKTPLTSIVSYVDLLQKEEIPSETAREYLAVLQRQAQRLRKLTEDLVEASKASTGNIPVSLAPTDLNVLLNQVCGEYQQRLEQQNLEPVCTPSPEDLTVQADGRLLWRVLDNLMSNVCKYALPGTRVYLSTQRVEGRGEITVKNISRYALNVSPEELTERFVRGDSARSTEGSGLGLSIAESLTRLQGGEFQLAIDGDLFKVQISFPL